MTNERVEVLQGILAGHPDGLNSGALLAALKERWPHLTSVQAQAIIDAAGETVTVSGTRIALANQPQPDPGPQSRPGTRIVSFDCETCVRLIAKAPYTEARLFQIAALRLGTDTQWCEAAPTFEHFVTLPEGFEIYNPTTRARHAELALSPNDVLEAFRLYVAEADFLVAYNGEAADFEFIDTACDMADLEHIDEPRRVDALYLALALHPQLSVPHALYDLARHLGIDLEGLTWHDALADAQVLARLLEHLAGALRALSPDVLTVIAALGADSEPWRMLFALAELDAPLPVALDDGVVTSVLEAELSARSPLRSRPRTSVGAIPTALKGTVGVDPHLLARSARGGDAEERPSQGQMATVIRGWISAGHDGMCEAPTGIGKSYVTLSTALEWLESHPSGRVVIATYTKQLQRQLAAEIEGLAEGDLAWLRPAAGLVKGARNRLSLRAIVRAVADCSDELAGPPPPTRTRPVLWRELRFRELLSFLFLRLCSPTFNLTDEWESRSVDPMDVPAFFEDYTAGSLSRWLGLLSQGESSDYGSPPASGPTSPPTSRST